MAYGIPVGLSPAGARPFPTVPVFLRSMYQLSVFPAVFLSVKVKMAFPLAMASFFCAGSLRPSSIMSKATEEANAGSEIGMFDMY